MADKALQSLSLPGLNDTYVNTPLSTAPTFVTTQNYAVDDCVFYNRKLYKFIAVHSAGAWDNSHVQEITIADELNNVKSNLNDLSESVSGKYTKPSTGIPASDLASGVIPDVSGKLDAPQTAGTQGQVLTSDGQGGQSWEDASGGTVTDVQVNGVSILDSQTGEADIPVADSSVYGVVKASQTNGIYVDGNGVLAPTNPTSLALRLGNNSNYVVNTGCQHTATFYGLAKAAGDTTQSASSNAVGTYTDNAKAAIKAMLDITGECQTVTVTGTTPTITATQNTRYVCGEVATLDFTPSATGICDVIFLSGSTATVLTLPNTVILPSWFDATALEANTTYEISISDGVYGAVMVW